MANKATPKLKKETIAKHVDILARLAGQKRHKGLVPTAKWLNDNGFFRSYEVMMNNPSAFKHLKRNYARG